MRSSTRSGEWTWRAGVAAAVKAGTTTGWPQPGHLTFLPARSSLTFKFLPQLTHGNEIIMTPKRETTQSAWGGIDHANLAVYPSKMKKPRKESPGL